MIIISIGLMAVNILIDVESRGYFHMLFCWIHIHIITLNQNKYDEPQKDLNVQQNLEKIDTI